MSVLDQLLEKKDVELYLKFRIEFLENTRNQEIMKEPEDKRELIRQRFKGRIDELNKMLTVLANGQLKDKCKSYFHKNERFEPAQQTTYTPYRYTGVPIITNASSWICSNCGEGNGMVKYCTNCGTPR